MNRINIVGGGITGCSLAHFLKDSFEVHLYEKNDHLGGLCATYKNIQGIPYQLGSHVLHTNDKSIVDFISNFVPLVDVEYHVAIDPLFDLRYYDFPFTPKSLSQMPWHWKEAIEMEMESTSGSTAKNLKDLIINFYGESAYVQFFEGWLKKWFHREGSSLDIVDWFRRYLRPVEYHGYYSEKYQMFPINSGWNNLFLSLTKGINTHLRQEVSFEEFSVKDIIILTGRPDLFFAKERLEYTTLSFDIDSCQYSSNKPDTIIFPNHVPFISITQFGKFFPDYEKSIVVKDYPGGDTVAHPVPRRKNFKIIDQIRQEYPNVILAGRIGSYQFYDIADCIRQAISIASEIKHKGVN